MDVETSLLSELIEICYALRERNDDLGALIGGESTFLEEEIERLLDLILDLSGATKKRNEYHDSLYAQGAANVPWPCLEDIDFKLYANLPAEQLAAWLIDYANGRIDYGEVGGSVAEMPSHGELVKKHGLLPPREERKR